MRHLAFLAIVSFGHKCHALWCMAPVCWSDNLDTCAATVYEAVLEGMDWFILNPQVPAGFIRRLWFYRLCRKAGIDKQTAYEVCATARAEHTRGSCLAYVHLNRLLNATSKFSYKIIARAKFHFVAELVSDSGIRACWSAREDFSQSSLPSIRNTYGGLAHSAKQQATLI